MERFSARTRRHLLAEVACVLFLMLGLCCPVAASAATSSDPTTLVPFSTSESTGTSDSSNAVLPDGLTALSVDQSPYQPTSSFPTTYDLRDHNASSGVRDQTPWGTCWIFGTVASAESNIMRQTGKETDLSEKQLAFFSKTDVNAQTKIAGRAVDSDQYDEGSIHGYNGGGEPRDAGQLLTSWQGVTTETAIPYVDSDGSLSSDESLWGLDESQRSLAVAHATDASELASPASYSDELTAEEKAYNATVADADKIIKHCDFNAAGVDSIKTALMNTGAVAVSYHADQSRPAQGSNSAYFNYETGGYYIPQLTANTWGNHIITIIGWDDTFAASNFGEATPSGDGAFLCKNSWGKDSWGATYYSYNGEKVTYARETGKSTLSMYKTDGTLVASGLTYTGRDAATKTFHFTDATGTVYDVVETPTYPDSPTWDGYFWLSYHDATICNAVSITMDVANASGTFFSDYIYEYDFLGQSSPLVTSVGAFDSAKPVEAANVFTAQANESLGSVSAATSERGSKVSVSVYRLTDDATSPTQSASGTPELTTSATFGEAGYHTIELPSAVNLRSRERFSVVETITSADGGYLPLELAEHDLAKHETVAKAGSGESYFSSDGGSTWTDTSTLKLSDLTGKTAATWTTDTAADVPDPSKLTSIGNVEIRAFTSDWSPDPSVVDETGTGVTATNLSDVAAAAAAANPNAHSTTVALDVKNADAEGTAAAAIRKLAATSGLTFDAYYDVTLAETVDGVTTDISADNDVLLGITYPYDFSGKGALHVFASHDGEAHEITTTPNSEGEYYVADVSAGTITVYSKRCCTFALAHEVAPATTGVAGNATTDSGETSYAGTPKTADAADVRLPLAMVVAGMACLVAARRKASDARGV